MDERIFLPESMNLRAESTQLGMEERIHYDDKTGTLFLNFAGMEVKNRRDVELIRQAVEQRCKAIGRRVDVIANYDSFKMADAWADPYAEMCGYMMSRYYQKISRSTTSAFMRMKLGDALSRRGLAPHIFEAREEAGQFLRDAKKEQG